MLFAVHGSCVTREIFNFQLMKDAHAEVSCNIGRNSIVSTCYPPVENPLINELFPDFDNPKGMKWEERMIFYDIKKEALNSLFHLKPDFLVIDLLDERFGIAETNIGTITYSQVLDRWDKLPNIEIYKRYPVREEDPWFEECFRKYCMYLREHIAPERIIINEAYPSFVYKKENGDIAFFEKDTLKISSIIKRLEVGYSLLKKYLPDAHYISMSRNVMGWEKNRLGLSYVHFEDDFYLSTGRNILDYTHEL